MINKLRGIRLDKFDFFCLLLLIPITLFALTPSSYGAALSLFGFEGEGLLLGKPREIRSDEWAVWTPYIQMAVLNGFDRFNELSTYHHDLRGFNAVPLADWALIFKPLMWPFWIFEPARAFALHHGLIIVTFLVGWKRLLVLCLSDIDISIKKRNQYASLFSLLIFFTGFVQFWWTTLGPILALSPWLLFIVLQWRDSIHHYIKLFYVASVWLLSHTYPPIIISIAYFGILLLFVHKPHWWKSSYIKFIFYFISCFAAVLVCFFYYKDIIPVMMNTVYPGQRISQGGEGNGLILLSTFFPYISHSGFRDLLNLNICEIGSVGTLLPLTSICFLKLNWTDSTFRKAFWGSLIFSAILIFWTVFPIPSSYGKWLLLDKLPGNRTIFIFGILVNYISLIAFASGEIRFSLVRACIFSSIILISYFIPSFLGLVGFFEKSAPEVLSVILMFIWLLLGKLSKRFYCYKKVSLLIIILIPNIIVYARFNPIQQAFPIFDLSNRQLINEIKGNSNVSEPHWVIETGYPGAVLSGVGLNSFSTVLIQPKMFIFRKLYPMMPEHDFNQIFNRYAHIWLDDSISYPYSPSPDVIVIPLRDVIDYYPQSNLFYQNYTEGSKSSKNIGGSIDSVIISNDGVLTITGWSLSKSVMIEGIFDFSDVIKFQMINRPDVAKAFSDSTLRNSGFLISIKNFSIYESTIQKQGICLVSQDSRFGLRLLDTSHLEVQFQCKKRNM
ncbi:TPA: hypothetical protein PX805_003272 [Vibrio cholerae]|nr:hypothetical protein [Vibrio cholerae]